MGYCFFLLLFSVAARLVSHGKWQSGNDGADKLFWGYKKLKLLLFIGGI